MEQEPELIPYSQWSTEDTAKMRRLAYADPDLGSDQYFSKAVRLRAAGKNEEAQIAESLGLARVAEIKAAYPYLYPEE